MPRTDLLSHPLPHHDRRRHQRAFYVSLAVHGVFLCVVLTLTYFYRNHQPPVKSGSAPGAPTITLATLVVTAPPQPPTPPAPVTPATPPLPPSAPAPSVPPVQPPPKIESPPPPDAAVPVLATQTPPAPAPPSQVTSAKPTPASHPTITHTTTATSTLATHTKSASAPSNSSYSSGRNVLPHPPYPDEARSLRQTGTVLMNVQFDSSGAVAAAEVAQSSGVKVLDSSTRSFIRANWHSPEYAGQTISVPVQYTLENL